MKKIIEMYHRMLKHRYCNECDKYVEKHLFEKWLGKCSHCFRTMESKKEMEEYKKMLFPTNVIPFRSTKK